MVDLAKWYRATADLRPLNSGACGAGSPSWDSTVLDLGPKLRRYYHTIVSLENVPPDELELKLVTTRGYADVQGQRRRRRERQGALSSGVAVS